MTDIMQTQNEWHEFRLFYDPHQVCADDLIAQINSKVAPYVCPWWFIRYWDGGPHIRLRFDALHTPRPIAREWLRNVDTGEPFGSPSAEETEAYHEMGARQAAREGMLNFETRLRTPGTIEEVAYRPEAQYYAGTIYHGRVEDHFVKCSQFCVRGLSSSSRGAREARLFAVMCIADTLQDREPGVFTWAAHSRIKKPLLGWVTQEAVLRMQMLCQEVSRGDCTSQSAYDLYCWTLSFRNLLKVAPARFHRRLVRNCVHMTANRMGISPTVEDDIRLLVGGKV